MYPRLFYLHKEKRKRRKLRCAGNPNGKRESFFLYLFFYLWWLLSLFKTYNTGTRFVFCLTILASRSGISKFILALKGCFQQRGAMCTECREREKSERPGFSFVLPASFISVYFALQYLNPLYLSEKYPTLPPGGGLRNCLSSNVSWMQPVSLFQLLHHGSALKSLQSHKDINRGDTSAIPSAL